MTFTIRYKIFETVFGPCDAWTSDTLIVENREQVKQIIRSNAELLKATHSVEEMFSFAGYDISFKAKRCCLSDRNTGENLYFYSLFEGIRFLRSKYARVLRWSEDRLVGATPGGTFGVRDEELTNFAKSLGR